MRRETVSITELEEAALDKYRAARHALDDADQARKEGDDERALRLREIAHDNQREATAIENVAHRLAHR